MEEHKGPAGSWSREVAPSSPAERDGDAPPKSLKLPTITLSVVGVYAGLGIAHRVRVVDLWNVNRNLYTVFYNGGPQVLFWGTLIVWVGAMAQAASLAEMSSILPIAGAQYHWTAALAPNSYRKFITWIQGQRKPKLQRLTKTGWLTWLAWLALLDSILSVTVNLIQGVVILNDPDMSFEPWQSFLMMMCILSVLYVVNVYFFWIVPWFELFSGIFHVVFFFVYMGVLLGFTKNKHSADFVFFSRVDSSTTSGWETGVVSWHLGLLTPIWTFSGFDAAVHLSEETRKAKLAVPRVIFWSIFSNGIFAICMIIATLYCAGDILDVALNSPFPFVTIAQQATGSTAGAMWMGIGLIFMAFSGSLGSMVSVSRLTWAWARDRGFGHVSPFFAAVNARRIPERAVALSSVATVILSVPNVKSTIAFAALTSLSTLALYLSYAVAIACMLLNRFGVGSRPAALGDWNLGRWGACINAYAIVHSLYMSFWLPWPSSRPTSAGSMNWAGPITGVVLLVSAATYPYARKRWRSVDEVVVEKVVRES